MAPVVECSLARQKVAGWIPGQDTCLGDQPTPQGWAPARGNRWMFSSLSFFLSPLRDKKKKKEEKKMQGPLFKKQGKAFPFLVAISLDLSISLLLVYLLINA